MSTGEREIFETTVAGIPTLWVEAPGTFTGALVVRAGRADETLRNGGITHFVEHATLSPIGRQPYAYNGHVDDILTTFYAAGRSDEVAGFLAAVCTALRKLPLDRLEAERRALAAETHSREQNLTSRLMAMRFGPHGYGLVDYEELGLGWLQAEHLQSWADERFTAGNAVLWLSGPPPDGLELALGTGQRMAPPPPEAIPGLELPCELADGTGGVALSLLAPRSTALHAGFHVALERAHERLRRDAALSYAPNGAYFPLDGRQAMPILHADCRDVDAGRVRDDLLEIYDDLAANGPTEDELEWDRSLFERSWADPETLVGYLAARASDRAMGVEPPTEDELRRERAELTAGAVAKAMTEALETLIALVPTGTPPGAHRPLPPYSTGSPRSVDGKLHRATDEWKSFKVNRELLVADDAFTHIDPVEDARATIELATAFGLRLPSGGLAVIGRDGSHATLYRERYVDGEAALARIERGLGPERLIPLSERERAVADLARAELPPRSIGRLGSEIDSLPWALAVGEELVRLAECRRGDQVGVLAASDRRVMFLFHGAAGREFFDAPLDGSTRIGLKGALRKRLVVEREGSTTEFASLQPPERLAQFAELG